MRRGIVLGVLVAVGAVSLAVTTHTQQGEMVIEVEQLEDNLFVLRGGGGNSAAFVTSNGVVLVDTKLAGWGQPLIDKIAELTSNPVTTIINTHTHYDHTSGNVEFPTSVEFVAHENTAALLEEWNPVTGIGGDVENPFEASNGHGMPTRTFEDQLTLGSGRDQVDLYYFGPGHTGGDTWVVFRSLGVVHAGDMFPSQMVPIMDKNNGGSGLEYPQTLWNAVRGISDVDRIITGHGAVMTPADLRQFAAFVGNFVTSVSYAKARGVSVEEFADTWQIPPRYRGYTRPPQERLLAYTQVIYDELDEAN